MVKVQYSAPDKVPILRYLSRWVCKKEKNSATVIEENFTVIIDDKTYERGYQPKQ